jgi:hypothetical protein
VLTWLRSKKPLSQRVNPSGFIFVEPFLMLYA